MDERKSSQTRQKPTIDPWDEPTQVITIEDMIGACDPYSDHGDLTAPGDQSEDTNLPPSPSVQGPGTTDQQNEPCREPAIGDTRRVIVDGETRWFLKVFDPQQAKSLCGRQGFGDLLGSGLVRAVADDPHLGWRRMPLGTSAMLEQLADLARMMPNFLPVTEFLNQAVAASKNTNTPISLEPMILLGPAGIGKTRFAQQIAEVFSEPFFEISMPVMTGTSTLIGQDPVWRNARPGRLTDALSSNRSASPIFFLDEFEKVYVQQASDQPLDVFHQLWEPQNAKKIRDECAGLSFSASSVIWLASANDLVGIRSTILDRAHIITIAPPTHDQSRAIAVHAYGEAIKRWDGWFARNLPAAAFELLVGRSPRQIKRTLALALARAAAEGRKTIEPSDIVMARNAFAGPKRQKIGFV